MRVTVQPMLLLHFIIVRDIILTISVVILPHHPVCGEVIKKMKCPRRAERK